MALSSNLLVELFEEIKLRIESLPCQSPLCRDLMGVVIVFLIALCFRVACLIIVQPDAISLYDPKAYDEIAQSVVAGRGFVENRPEGGTYFAYRMPLFPLFLALIYLIFGHNLLMVQSIQIFISSVTCAIVFLTGKHIGEWIVGFIAGSILALNLSLTYFCCTLMTETLVMFWFSIALWRGICFLQRGKLIDSFIVGITWGLAILTHPNMVLSLGFGWVFLVMVFLLKRDRSLWRIAFSFIIPILAVIILLPWSFRNFLLFGTNLPLTSSAGINFWIGNGLGATGAFHPVSDFLSGLSELEGYYQGFNQGLAQIFADPFRMPVLLLLKLIYLWGPNTLYYHPLSERLPWSVALFLIPDALSHLTLLWVAGLGFILNIKFRRNLEPFLFFTVILTGLSITSLVFFGLPRFIFPFLGILAIFCAMLFHSNSPLRRVIQDTLTSVLKTLVKAETDEIQ